MERAHGLLRQSAALLQSREDLATAAACLIKAFFLSEGFAEVSSLYRLILGELLQPLLGASSPPKGHALRS